MKTRGVVWSLAASALVFGMASGPLASSVDANDKKNDKKKTRKFSADLSGYNEVPTSLSIPAKGRFRARLSRDGQSLRYELSYRDLSPGVRFSHIHLGRSGTNGGVIVYLCQTAARPDPTMTAPTCEEGKGRVTGEVTADNVIGPAAQGIAPGEFDELVDALRNGAAYVNLHTDTFPGGELRGQVR